MVVTCRKICLVYGIGCLTKFCWAISHHLLQRKVVVLNIARHGIFPIIFKTPQFRQFSVHPNKWSVIRISRMASLNLIAPNQGLIWPQDNTLLYLEIQLTDSNNLAFSIFWLKRRTDQHDMMWFQIAGMKLILWPTAIILKFVFPVYCYTNYLWHAAS